MYVFRRCLFNASNLTKQTKTISVSFKGDDLFESTENFFVNLSNATNATISDNKAIGTIKNDDDNIVFAKARGVLDNVREAAIGNQRQSVMTSLYQASSLDELTSSVNSLINTDTTVVI